MRIVHIYHNLNKFGGAEEHLTSLAVLQKVRGDDVVVCLIQSETVQNQYVQRLIAAGVPIRQWPVWISRLSGDWDTRETILHGSITFLTPLIVIIASLVTLVRHQPRQLVMKSVEGRLRMFLGRFLDPNRERQLFLLLLKWLYYRRRPDVLHVHSYGAELEYILQWAHAHHIPTIYQEHSTPDLSIRGWYSLPIGLNLASVVVAVSETSAQALRQLCGVTRPIYVVPPIVDISTPMTIGERPFRFEGREVQILTVAGLKKEKGLDYLIKAAEHVITVRPNVRFLIYGEGYLFERLESEIDSLNLRGKVFLAGSFTRNDLPGIMNTADIFVLPSITEGFPLSIVEAMAWGLPIAATAVGGIPELIEDGVTGLLCPPEDDNALAEIILTLVDNPLRSQALGDAARKSYNNGGFKPECIVERYAEIYSIMLNGNGMKS